MTTTFTREAVTKAFEDILAEYGEDHKYIAPPLTPAGICFYSDPTGKSKAPGCIVGHIIHRLNPETYQLIAELEADTLNSCDAEAVLEGYWNGWADDDGNTPEDARTLTDDEGLVRAVARAQARQDRGETWGTAFEAYKSILANFPN